MDRGNVMTQTVAPESALDIRELSDEELSKVSGGTWNIDFNIFGYRIFIQGGGYWAAVCVAGDDTYGCVSTVGGQIYTSSGDVPK
jgi:bacteriocin-like protein